MAFIETNHTQSVLNKLRKEIERFLKFVRIATLVGFTIWYVYLIATNVTSLPRLVAYVALFVMFVVTHVVEMKLKPTDEDNHKSKREKLEKRRKISKGITVARYLAKLVTVVVALYTSLNTPTAKLNLVLDAFSAVMWIVSLLCEFVGAFVNKYIDYFTISVAMDFEQSGVVNWVKGASKFFGNKQLELDDINNELMADSGESMYTGQEQRIREMLTEEATTLREQKAERKKQKKAKVEEQLEEAKAKKKQVHADKVAATKAEKQRLAEEKRQAKRDKDEAKRAEKKRLAEEKKQARKPKTEQ